MLSSARTCWGECVLRLGFAGIGYRINGLSDFQYRRLQEFYKLLTVEESTGGDELETWIYRRPKQTQDAGRYNKNGIYTPVLRLQDRKVEIEGYGFHAVISTTPRLHGELYADDGDLLATPIIFENYLRIIAAYAALMRGGLLVHSAGIVIDSRAYLFLGYSGAGKTTLSRLALAAGAKILSDDINMVFPATDGGFIASAVPFAGEMGHMHMELQGQYRVAGVFWLEKSTALECENIAPTVQHAKLFACSPMVNADKHQLDRIFGVCTSLLKTVPMRLLRFRRNESFASLYKILSEHGAAE